MAEHLGVFATLIKCMDGRDLRPAVDLVRSLTNADYVDTITWPGADRALADDVVAQTHFERCVGISVEKHGSKEVFIFGHDECAGNPVDRNTHLKHEEAAAHVIKRRFPSVNVRHGHVDFTQGIWKATLNEE